MGRVKTFERSAKRGLMRVVGGALRARPLTVDAFRAMDFARILVVRQHNQMGDMMLATPALRAIRETYPRAQIGIVTSTLNRGVLANSPFVDHVFTYDKRRPATHVAMLQALRRQQFDLAIVLHTVSFSFTTLMLGVVSGARVRIGSTSPRIGDALTGSYLNITLPLPDPAQLAGMNEAEHNLFPLRAVGITTDDLSPLIVPGEASERWAEEFAAACWSPGTVKLAVHPGAGKTENIWKPENFAAVVNALAQTTPVSVAVVQGPADAGTARAFEQACHVRGTLVRGRSITDVAALMKRADLVVCNDTGVMHVACAAGARVLGIFGPTDPVRWAPRSPGLRVVRAPGGDLRALEPESVVREAISYLRISNAGSA
jgi:ADP-heptose:LPS heptosyltransferase